MARRRRWSSRGLVGLLALLLVVGAFPLAASAEDLTIADPAFERVWQQADAPVAGGSAQRSWLWGPEPIGVSREYYEESTAPVQLRLVQYFDKSRMEITYPDGDPNSIWYVTNGLLVKELVSGLRQYGDDFFIQWGSASIPVAGDLTDRDSPQYHSFAGVATLDGSSHRAGDRTGTQATAWIDVAGVVSQQTAPATATFAYYEPTLGHNIPDVFWNWINNPANGILTYGSWVYPMGYPIAEPYWVHANVGGVEREILVQLFERRVLTWTPANDPAWQVEMGNVGRAYMSRFKQPSDGTPIWSPDGERLAFASLRVGNSDLYVINADGSDLRQMTNSPYGEAPHAWLPNGRIVMYRSGDNRDQLLDPATGNTEYLPMMGTEWSPDGSLLAYPSGQGSDIAIRVRNADGSNDHIAAQQGGYCNGWIAFSPDSQQLAYCRVNLTNPANPVWSVHVVNVDGSDDHVVLDNLADTAWVDRLSWSPDSTRLVVPVRANAGYQLFVVEADGSGSTLFDLDVESSYFLSPTWSPVSEEIVFGSAPGIYIVNADGSGLRQLRPTPGERFAWSSDGTEIAFIEDNNLAVINADGSNYRVIDVPQLIQ